MVLTFLVLIHRCFFSKNQRPESPTESSGSEVAELQESASANFSNHIRKERGSVQQTQSISKAVFERSLLPTATNSQTNFRLDFAVVAVCRFSTSFIAAPLLQVEEPCFKFFSMSSEEKFRAAVRVIHSLPKDGPYQPSNSTKLKFYGLYKQATEGKNCTTQPRFWDVIGRAKWDAWNKLGDMGKDEAMNQYVDGLKEIVETMSFNGDVEDFLDSIGPFYEFVTLQGDEMSHVKEKIDASSSGGSSLANSLQASTNNSKQASPLKEICAAAEEENVAEEEEDEASTSETAEVSVETTTATYETKAGKNYSSHNGTAFKSSSIERHVTYDEPISTIPPPAPTHSYAHHNGFVKKVPPLTQDDDEVLSVPYIPCKEDLECDEEEESTGHAKVKVTSSIETVASVATSGTESEKYYSGDSEPEMDEKYMASFAVSSSSMDCYPSTSSAALQQQMLENSRYNNLSSTKHLANSTSQAKKVKSPRVSHNTSPSSLAVCRTDADVAVQQTVERLNRDVDHILARLRILEAAYAANAEGAMRNPAGSTQTSSRRGFRIFGELSPQSIAFIVMWPFVVQFLIKLLRWWWRRRRLTAMRSLR